jgi:hypothetical protein
MKRLTVAPAAVAEPATSAIVRALRRARQSATRTARMHKVPMVYLSRGKIVRQIP